MKPQPPDRGHQARYGYGRTLDLPFARALERTRAGLQDEGFGVLFEIDMRGKLQEKLGVDFPPYTILGACSPPVAHRALLEEQDLGLLLPCNVIVYEEAGGRSTVKAVDAVQMMSITGNDKLESPAVEVNERLRKVIDAL
jgi:uncharacterized protein (DUF302 family)